MIMISKHLIFFIFLKNSVIKIIFLNLNVFVINETDYERRRNKFVPDLDSIIIKRININSY